MSTRKKTIKNDQGKVVKEITYEDRETKRQKELARRGLGEIKDKEYHFGNGIVKIDNLDGIWSKREENIFESYRILRKRDFDAKPAKERKLYEDLADSLVGPIHGRAEVLRQIRANARSEANAGKLVILNDWTGLDLRSERILPRRVRETQQKKSRWDWLKKIFSFMF